MAVARAHPFRAVDVSPGGVSERDRRLKHQQLIRALEPHENLGHEVADKETSTWKLELRNVVLLPDQDITLLSAVNTQISIAAWTLVCSLGYNCILAEYVVPTCDTILFAGTITAANSSRTPRERVHG